MTTNQTNNNKQKYKLIIDTRENDLINHFNQQNIEYTKAQLDLGDIIITSTNKESTMSILIERKTTADLIASIKDGRYKEQKARMGTLHNKYFFIIEGKMQPSRESDKKMLWGAVISTQFRDKIDIIRCFDIDETVYFIMRLLERLEKEGCELFNSHLPPEAKYIDVIKTKKKENITPAVCHAMALATIPSINTKTADAIIKYYGSLAGLIEAYSYEETREDKELMISKVLLPSGRHVGESISRKIYNYLFLDPIMEEINNLAENEDETD